METTRVTTWAQLKQLTKLAEQYSIEDKQYDTSFAVYATELTRRWQLNNHEFYLLHNGTLPIGYTIVHTDDTGLNNTLYVYDLFIGKDFRGAKGFYSLIKLINQICIDNNIPRAEFPSELGKETWEKLTQLPVAIKNVVVIDNIEYKE